MSDKPSRNEDEYFARQERETIERQREEARKAQVAAERKSHYMKCPKDGGDLVVETVQGVQIDRCPECQGIWLDAGELEALARQEESGFLGRVFGDVLASFRGKSGRS